MMFPEGQKRRLRLAAALTALLLLLAGCGGQKIVSPQVTAEEHRLNAALLIDKRQFAKAEQELDQALLKAPQNTELHLLQGELLQVLDRPAEAAETYRRGLEHAAGDSAAQATLAHRLGLLELLTFGDVDKAEALAASLPESSLERIDLSGSIALAADRPVAALKIFSRAPITTTRPAMAAWIRYHAARAYHQLEDEKNTRAALYVAVNHAEDIVLKQAIESFWNEINPTH